MPASAPPLAADVAATPWQAPRRIVAFLFLLAILLTPPLIYEDDPYRCEQFAKIAALALFALSIDLIWGYTGLLSLGQGLYFGLGAYAIGYSLKLQQAALRDGMPLVAAPDMSMPDFMEFSRMPRVPP